MTKREHYRTILIDPPWNERGGGKSTRGAQRHYPLMTTRQISNLLDQVLGLRHPEYGHLWLWATNNHLPAAFSVVDSSFATYITTITWPKPSIGLGQYARGMTEHVLFYRWGQPPYKTSEGPLPDDLPEVLTRRKDGRHQTRTLIPAPKGAHSEKPAIFRRMVEWMSYGPYLELFAREQAPGWDSMGLELDGTTIEQQLTKVLEDS